MEIIKLITFCILTSLLVTNSANSGPAKIYISERFHYNTINLTNLAVDTTHLFVEQGGKLCAVNDGDLLVVLLVPQGDDLDHLRAPLHDGGHVEVAAAADNSVMDLCSRKDVSQQTEIICRDSRSSPSILRLRS